MGKKRKLICLLIIQTQFKTFLETLLRCLKHLLVAFCESDLKAMGYLWLIHKGKRKTRRNGFIGHTPEVSGAGLTDIFSFTSPVRLTSTFLVSRLLKECKPHYPPQRENRNKVG